MVLSGHGGYLTLPDHVLTSTEEIERGALVILARLSPVKPTVQKAGKVQSTQADQSENQAKSGTSEGTGKKKPASGPKYVNRQTTPSTGKPRPPQKGVV